MDPAEASASDGVMIAFLPTSSDWCKIELPHMTLVYAGLKSDLKPAAFNELTKDAASLSMLVSPFYLLVDRVDRFGDGVEPVNVLRFKPTSELWAMRRYVESWNKSQFPFQPHATIGPSSSPFVDNVPRSVGFDRLYVGWGEENLTFWLKNSGAY